MNAGKLTNKGKRWTKKEAVFELNSIRLSNPGLDWSVVSFCNHPVKAQFFL
jgi:hypothetical protein